MDNIEEELDFPREFYHDPEKGLLYFVSGSAPVYWNASDIRSAAEPKDLSFEHSQLKTLIQVQGTQANPVTDVTIQGVTLTGWFDQKSCCFCRCNVGIGLGLNQRHSHHQLGHVEHACLHPSILLTRSRPVLVLVANVMVTMRFVFYPHTSNHHHHHHQCHTDSLVSKVPCPQLLP